MQPKSYNFWNNLFGWIAFAIATAVYFLTLEPTVSLWDCGEFIAASYKLQVVHPPGAPFFLMLNNLFSILAPDPTWVPILINASSALASSFAVLFLFWSTTYLTKKMFVGDKELADSAQMIVVLGAGMVGALALTFSDTFWFSAVEAEVYALSTFFIAIVFWLMLKWEARANEKDNVKWLILIAYMVGLSISVHLLSLLALPVLAVVYYFKKTPKVTPVGLIGALLAGGGILVVIQVFIIKWIPLIAANFDKLFVNNFGLPFWSGVITFLILLTVGLSFGVYLTAKAKKFILHISLLCVLVITFAYTAYSMVVIRSIAGPSIDMNNPENMFNLLSYINREQYGERPILYGPVFTAQPIDYADGRTQYRKGKDRYKEAGTKTERVYDPSDKMLFPRMVDEREDRVNYYKQRYNLADGEKPSFAQNLHFFFSYQLGHMYWRYFAWNFIGRQNDEQGPVSNYIHGNWLSGISFIDELRLPSQDNLPYFQRINKAHNTMFFLPFLLGLLGAYFHFKRKQRDAFTILYFFLFTGVILCIYLNNPPNEPRERDYTLVGSFYVFCIWIGIGVAGLYELLRSKISGTAAAATASGISLLAGPLLMANQVWDDHDRSKRYTTLDFAKNYLESCDHNGILFTNGDNDTYPLWYAQEVEGIRDDVRIINMQLLSTEWYIESLRRPINNSDGLKLSMGEDKLVKGVRDYAIYVDPQRLGLGNRIDKDKHYPIQQLVDFIASDRESTKVAMRGGTKLHAYPIKKLYIDVDKQKVIDNKVVSPKYYDQIVDRIEFDLKKNTLLRGDIILLDLLANNHFERPIHFAITSGSSAYFNLGDYFQQEGLAYRLVPLSKEAGFRDGGTGFVDTERMYENVMEKFKWGNLPTHDVYIGSVTRRHCNNYRAVFSRLAKALAREGQQEKAIEALDRCQEVIPFDKIPYEFNTLALVEAYYAADAHDKALELGERFYDVLVEETDYYNRQSPEMRRSLNQEIRRNAYAINRMGDMAQRAGQDDFYQKVQNYLNSAL